MFIFKWLSSTYQVADGTGNPVILAWNLTVPTSGDSAFSSGFTRTGGLTAGKKKSNMCKTILIFQNQSVKLTDLLIL